jgi:hypothetical protein
MAIRTIPTVPSELPHARLYLDDIEEISSILLKAAALDLAKWGREARISYAIGDTKMDSIRDLETLGGGTTKFDINVGPWGPSVSFRFYSNPQVLLQSLDAEQAWATYGVVKSIFDRRQLTVKNAVDSLPLWLKLSLWALFVVSPSFIFHAIHGRYFLIGYGVLLATLSYVFSS